MVTKSRIQFRRKNQCGENVSAEAYLAFAIHPKRAHPDLNQGPADLQSADLTTELCTHLIPKCKSIH